METLKKINPTHLIFSLLKTPTLVGDEVKSPPEAESYAEGGRKKKIPRVYPGRFIFLLFVVLHIALFNINAAEWGDSYRILRASEFIREGSYPNNEKRPPLYSFVLAVRPDGVDQVLWGRVIMFGLSIASFWVFYKLCGLFSQR